MAFRIGRKHAYHTYPEPRFAGAIQLARNFAIGPKALGQFDIETTGTLIEWSSIDSVQAWSALTTYSIGSLVSNLGATWVSTLNNNIGNEPGVDAGWVKNTDIPITPISSGVVVIQGVISVLNSAVTDELVAITIRAAGNPLNPTNLQYTIPAGAEVLIPFLVEATGLPLGTTALVSVELFAETNDTLSLQPNNTTVEVREMQAATG